MTDQHRNAQSPQFTEAELAYVSSLFDAARNGDTQLLSSALDAGVPVNLTNSKGDTLLNLAAYLEREETVAMLLARGADTERVSDMGFTALVCAVFRGNEPIARALLEAGAGQATGHQHAQDVARVFGQEHLLPLLESYETCEA
ncbi:ankyrin repeat domain-containing protein [Kocuria sp. CPCC 205297]|uniref:ankyrin repeat domain-containing protein n=1 Tax=Kocuria sp. CPCC 205297 TaxID=3073558 RepID=UPI0034D3F7B5